mmetsp:Transcript_22195/g.26154  ORF Transcript_22195/g.26154 Transcript_22195/m.26154 type:complete len:217 (-) Transcript_22195:6-656(-)
MRSRLILGVVAALALAVHTVFVEPSSFSALRGSPTAHGRAERFDRFDRGSARASRTSSGNVLFASAAAMVACVTCCALRTGLRSRRQSSSVVAQALAPSGESLLPAGSLFAGATPRSANDQSSNIPRRLLMPKNIKWRKPHKPPVKPWDTGRWKFKGEAWRGNKPYFGKYALQIHEEAWINQTNIEACRRMMVRTMRKENGKVWLRVFPHSAITGP